MDTNTNTNDIARHLSPDEAEIESISDVIFFQWDACNEVTPNRRDQRNDFHFLSPRTDRHNRNAPSVLRIEARGGSSMVDL